MYVCMWLTLPLVSRQPGLHPGPFGGALTPQARCHTSIRHSAILANQLTRVLLARPLSPRSKSTTQASMRGEGVHVPEP